MKPLFRSVRLGSMALWLTALFAALARTVHAAGPVVRCEPCDASALGQCKPLPRDCAERVREPGCGCCLTCALHEGQACGVYTGRCGSGLRCQHRPGESKPLLALLEGRGVCTKARDRNLPSRVGKCLNVISLFVCFFFLSAACVICAHYFYATFAFHVSSLGFANLNQFAIIT